jgi:hypothetical protein
MFPGQFIASTVTTWAIPTGITTVRVRLWGGGGGGYGYSSTNYTGAGGGFALKTFTGLTPGTSVTITAGSSGFGSGSTGGTSSFAVSGVSTVSATGGGSTNNATSTGGSGSGGDINVNGESVYYNSITAGQAGSLYTRFGTSTNGTSNGIMYNSLNSYIPTPTNPLDKIGAGTMFGAAAYTNGAGGLSGLGTSYAAGGFPGGGGPNCQQNAGNSTNGGPGLVIIEY